MHSIIHPIAAYISRDFLLNAILAVGLAIFSQRVAAEDSSTIAVVSDERNNLLQMLGGNAIRYENIDDALDSVPDLSALLVLATGYPDQFTPISKSQWDRIDKKQLRLLIEYPSFIPGMVMPDPMGVRWERGVVTEAGRVLGLEPLTIVSLQDCRYLPLEIGIKQSADVGSVETGFPRTKLVVGRVAGFDHAQFGIPEASHPILIQLNERIWISTTQISNFVDGRYAPHEAWKTLWNRLIAEIHPEGQHDELEAFPRVRPRYGKEEPLPIDVDKLTVKAGADWFKNSRLLLNASRAAEIESALLAGTEVVPAPDRSYQPGDGTFGILEGYASQILPDGNQLQRTPIRADCQAETAAALAMNAIVNGDTQSRQIAANLLDYLYEHSELHQGERGDINHPAYGLIAWGAISPAWKRANYGDDNARVLLATMVCSGVLKSEQWDEPMLRALYANLLTTGIQGFRGDRIDIPDLEAQGREKIAERDIVNMSPFFESYLWACYLWAYKHTGDERFYSTALKGIERSMAVYPNGWRWGDNLDRSHMLLALAWLVRIDDQAKHQAWLRLVMDDFLKNQVDCGAIPEALGNPNSGHYQAPTSNEAYGTMETPLIQNNGDPVSDQLYVTGFALLALREVNAAIDDPKYRNAEDRLAEYAIRIQVSSPSLDYLNGTWFRAFDFDKWDYWSSSGDMGWGAWCAEAGWGPAWNMIVIGLRHEKTSVWDVTSKSTVRKHLSKVQREFLLSEEAD